MSGNNVLSLLGLALRGGRLAVGEEPAALAAKAGQARLLLTASDAAGNTLRRAEHLAEEGHCLWLVLPFTKAELGGALGRASAAIAALTDLGLAAAVAERLARLDPERYGEAAARMDLKRRRAKERQAAPRRDPPPKAPPERREDRRPAKPRSSPPRDGRRTAEPRKGRAWDSPREGGQASRRKEGGPPGGKPGRSPGGRRPRSGGPGPAHGRGPGKPAGPGRFPRNKGRPGSKPPSGGNGPDRGGGR